jgi:hypothetical protein
MVLSWNGTQYFPTQNKKVYDTEKGNYGSFFSVYIILHKVLWVGGLFISRLLIGHAFYEAPILQKLHRKIILSYFMTWGLKKGNGNVNLNNLGYLEVNKGFQKK